jgi:hypothetical protein
MAARDVERDAAAHALALEDEVLHRAVWSELSALVQVLEELDLSSNLIRRDLMLYLQDVVSCPGVCVCVCVCVYISLYTHTHTHTCTHTHAHTQEGHPMPTPPNPHPPWTRRKRRQQR